ncbi:MAG TPA: hypothetical protein VHL59_06005 [Thermoanaerobaculia bacterium]|nr:hypothetical protein [Thermoanaerobaculia bacterium]
MRIVRGILGFLLGYAVVVLATEFGFRLLPDRPLHSGRPLIMAGAALVALTAGLAGGALASWIARSRIAGWLVLLPLIAETIWLLFIREGEPQTWLDAAAALTLLAAVAAGAYFAGSGKTTSPPTTV